MSKVVSPYNVASAYGSYGSYGVSKVVSPVSSVVSHGYGSPLVGGYAPAVGMNNFPSFAFLSIFLKDEKSQLKVTHFRLWRI